MGELVRARQSGKVGFIDMSGEVVIPFIYDDAYCFRNGVTCANVDGKYGVIDITGKQMNHFKYDMMSVFRLGLSQASLGQNYGVVNEKGEEVVQLEWDSVGIVSEDLFIVEKNGKYGLLNLMGVCLPPIYDKISGFSEGLAVISLKGKYGYIDSVGNIVIPMIYEDARPFSEGLAGVSKNGKYGFIDKDNNVVIEFKYTDVAPYSEGLAGVCLNSRWSFINKAGIHILPFIYNLQERHNLYKTNVFKDGFLTVKDEQKYGVIDIHGNIIVPFVSDEPCLYDGGLFRITHLDPLFDYKFDMGESRENLCIFVDRNGKQVTRRYNEARNFSEGLCAVRHKNKWGFIDQQGITIIPHTYDMVDDFHLAYTAVIKDGKSALIDMFGDICLPFKYDRLVYY